MIYVSSACIKSNRIVKVLQQLADSGVRSVELSGGTRYYPGIEHDLIEMKKRYDLQYACHAYFPPPQYPFVVNLASCNDQIYKKSIDHYERCIEMLVRIGCGTLSVHAGFLLEIEPGDMGKRLNKGIIYNENESYERFCVAYQYISRLCNENDITIFLENNVLDAQNYEALGGHNYLMMTDYASIEKVKKQLSFHLLLDLGHLYVSSNTLGVDYAEECQRLKEYVRWIHISENDGISDEHKALKKDSKIMEEYRKMSKSDINVTLETVGNMTEILASVRLAKANILSSQGEEQWC